MGDSAGRHRRTNGSGLLSAALGAAHYRARAAACHRLLHQNCLLLLLLLLVVVVQKGRLVNNGHPDAGTRAGGNHFRHSFRTGGVMDLLMEIFEGKIEFNWDIGSTAAGRC